MKSTDLEYGPLRSDEDRKRLRAAVEVSFDSDPDGAEEWLSRSGPDDLRVVRLGGEAVGGLRLLSMGQFYGGRSVPNMGIAGVAVTPEARGRGVARHLMREALRESRERGFVLSTLYASTAGLYRSVGYEQAGSYFRAVLRPRELPRTRSQLRVRAAAPDDRALMEELYRERARKCDGFLDRGEYMWSRLFAPARFTARAYVFEGEGGAEGYVVLHSKKGGGFQRLVLADWSARTPEALRAVLAFLAGHATLWKEIVFHPAAADPLLLSLPENPCGDVELHEHWMLRLTDVPAALERRGYPRGAEARLSFEVVDDVLPENGGRFVLQVSDGEARVEPGGEGAVRIDARTLAALYGGLYGADLLALAGRLTATEADRATADLLFAGAPSMTDAF